MAGSSVLCLYLQTDPIVVWTGELWEGSQILREATSRVWARRFVPAVVVGSVFFFLGQTLYQNWGRLQEYPWQISYPHLGLSVLLIGITFAFLVFVWLLVLRILGVRLSFRKGFRIWFVSTLGKYVPGKVWQALGMFYLCQREGISVQKSVTSFILVQVLSIVPGVALFLLTTTWLNPQWGASIHFLIVLIPLGLIAAHPGALERLVNFVARRLRREEIHLRARYIDMLGLMSLYLFSWFLYGCAFFTFVRAMGFVHSRYLVAFGGVFAGAYLLGLVAVFVPGGLGVREGAMAFLLTPFFPLPVATAISLASRIWLTVAEVICVGISLRGLRRVTSTSVGGEREDSQRGALGGTAR